MATMSHRGERDAGFIGALRRLRDPLLLFVVPIGFAVLVAFVGYGASWPIGFDFRGTLWEPARAFLEPGKLEERPRIAAQAACGLEIRPCCRLIPCQTRRTEK